MFQSLRVRTEKREVRVGDAVEVRGARRHGVVDGRPGLVPVREVGDFGVAGPLLAGVDEGRERRFALAPEDEIGVLQRFLGQVGHVGTAHEDRDAHGPDPVGDGVGPGRRRGDGRDADQVGRGDDIEIDLAEILDEELDLPAARPHHRPQDERSQPGQGELGEDVQVRGLRFDENDLSHGSPPWRPCRASGSWPGGRECPSSSS